MILTLVIFFVILIAAILITIFIVRKRTREDCANLNVSVIQRQVEQNEKEVALDQGILSNVKRDVELIKQFPNEAQESINSLVQVEN